VFRESSVHPWRQQLWRPHNAGLIRAEMVESSYIHVIDSSHLLSLPSLNHSSGIKIMVIVVQQFFYTFPLFLKAMYKGINKRMEGVAGNKASLHVDLHVLCFVPLFIVV
jgi:hypothetical protein